MLKEINETVEFIRSKYSTESEVGIVLGSGLGSFTNEIDIECEIPYSDIPNFPVSTVEGHSGKLIFGNLSGKKVVAMAGRFHYYEGYGTRFPDMSEPYKKEYIEAAKNIAKKNDILLYEGVYVGVTGPTFETRAEYKMLHILGGDVVGMSTVQEVICAAHMSIPVFAMSVITDVGIREEDNTITHAEVLEAAKNAEPKLTLIFKELISQL